MFKPVTSSISAFAARAATACAALLLLAPGAGAAAQAQCGVVESIAHPVDTTVFTLAQDYAMPSPRHHGRYHTGEDWYGGRGASLGQPVRAIAAGRVMLASPDIWGRDGGVVILEHVFPDQSVAYSLYGHIAEFPDTPFPTALTCVRAGDVIGAIADVRPAPHVHLEIKVNNPTLPGAGYAWEDPYRAGLRDPGKFIANWQAWLHPAHAWHLDLVEESGPIPPVLLDDGSVIYLDRGRVARLTADGRVLWRTNLDQAAVGLAPGQPDGALIVFADGTVQPVARDGTPGQGRALPLAPVGPPMPAGDVVLFPTTSGLVATDPSLGSALWRLDDVPPVSRWHRAGPVIGLLSERDEVLIVSSDGRLLDRARTRQGASFATAPDGGLLVYTSGGLWRVDSGGTWAVYREDAPGAGRTGATLAAGGALYLFDGDVLRAYDAGGAPVWEVAIPGLSGLARLDAFGRVLLLTTTDGHIIALHAESARLCDRARIFGDDRSRLWLDLGGDNVLRLGLADQLIGLNWPAFLGACA